jgi:hypothetical protein
MKAKRVTAKPRANACTPAKASLSAPSASRPSLGKRRATSGVHTRARKRLPSASPSQPRARGAKVAVPIRASAVVSRASRLDNGRDLGAELLESVREMKAGRAGHVHISGKRRGPANTCSQRANVLVPSAASPGPNIGGGGQPPRASKGQYPVSSPSDLPASIAAVGMLYEQRRDLLATASGLTNRLKALTKIRRKLPPDAKISEAMIAETDYPPLDTLLLARGVLRDHLKKLEGSLEELGETLPAYQAFWEPVKGLGALGLSLIIGEAGDLSKYSTHSKLWKRFGLHVMNGRALFTKRSGMSPEAWTAAGYCPRRRSLIYQIVDSLVKQDNRYRTLRDQRKEIEHAKAAAEDLTVLPAAKIPKASAEKYRSKGHVLNRANRYVGKKLLRDLWKVWRREATDGLPEGQIGGASRPPSNSAPGTRRKVSIAANRALSPAPIPSP